MKKVALLFVVWMELLFLAAQPLYRITQYNEEDGVPSNHITRHGVLLAAATDGLIVADLKADADKIEFKLHQRESNRVESLSSSATMDILEDNEGRILISTESGGMNQTDHPDLLSSQLAFTHLNTANHRLPSDCVMSLAPMPNGSTMIVSAHLIALLDNTFAAKY